jgi:STE24 endopeptidase
MAVLLEQRPTAESGRSTRRRLSAGWWQVVASGPAIAGSALLVVVVCALLAPWPLLAYVPLAVWAGGAAAALTRPGERVAVRLACGFHRPRADQAALLNDAAQRVLAAAGVPADRVDFYVRPGGQVNGFAAGGHSVAVSRRALEDFAARGHSRVVTEALLAHEVGHLVVPGARFGVAVWWLTMPGRAAAGAVITVCLLLSAARHQPRRLLVAVAAAGIAYGVAQAAGRGEWPAAACLAAVAILAVGCPLLRAAAGRATEYAADAFAASCGYGPALAWALQHTTRPPDPIGWVSRMRADHPAGGLRLAALAELSGRP